MWGHLEQFLPQKSSLFLLKLSFNCRRPSETKHSEWPLHLYFEDVSSVHDKRSFICQFQRHRAMLNEMSKKVVKKEAVKCVCFY